jgi:hypothetical protein
MTRGTLSSNRLKWKELFQVILPVIVAIVCLMSSSAYATPVTVVSVGEGRDRSDAIKNALLYAVEQVTGVKIESSRASAASLERTSTTNGTMTKLDTQYQEEMKQQSGGIVSSYEIVSDGKSAEGKYEITLSVTIEKFEAKGLANDNRRRVIVGAFTADTAAQCDQSMGSGCPNLSAFAGRLVERLTSYITLSRRFAVLDRTQDNIYAKEMNLIQSDDVPLKERVRLGQLLAADYVVVGKLNTIGAETSMKTNALTSEVTGKKQFSASVDFQVIDISTRQIKWAGTVKQVADNVETLAEFSAQTIGESITQTIYPLRAIKIDDPAAIVVNQGSDTIKVGQVFKAYRLGEELKDPYSKESLGRAEQEIAVLKITKVDAKVSYGALQSGAMANGDDILLRRVRAADLATEEASAKPKGGTSTPFD